MHHSKAYTLILLLDYIHYADDSMSVGKKPFTSGDLLIFWIPTCDSSAFWPYLEHQLITLLSIAKICRSHTFCWICPISISLRYTAQLFCTPCVLFEPRNKTKRIREIVEFSILKFTKYLYALVKCYIGFRQKFPIVWFAIHIWEWFWVCFVI